MSEEISLTALVLRVKREVKAEKLLTGDWAVVLRAGLEHKPLVGYLSYHGALLETREQRILRALRLLKLDPSYEEEARASIAAAPSEAIEEAVRRLATHYGLADLKPHSPKGGGHAARRAR